MMNPRLYTTSYNKPQGQQFDTAVLSFIKLQYTEKSCKMINIFVLVTILGHLPVILFAKRKGSEDMKQILIVEDDSFLNKMLVYNPVSYTHLDVYKRQVMSFPALVKTPFLSAKPKET